MEYNIPIVDEEVSTDDTESVTMPIFGALMGFLTLFGVIGAATYLFNRAKEMAGVDGETEIPGV
jgi:hypothetical protein